MDKLADPHPVVSQSALVSLQRIAMHYRYTSLSDLVISNADYLVDSISSRLRAFRTGGDGGTASDAHFLPRVLRAMLERTGAGSALIPLLDDTLQSILDSLSLSTEAGPTPTTTTTSAPIVTTSLLTSSERAERDRETQKSSTANAAATTDSDRSSTLASLQLLLSIVSAIQQSAASNPGSGGGVSATRRLEMRSEQLTREQRFAYYRPDTFTDRLSKLVGQLRESKREMERGIDFSDSGGGSHYFEERVKSKAEEKARADRARAAGGDDPDADDKSAPYGAANDAADDARTKPTREQQIVIDVLAKCRHFLSSPSIRQQYLVLSIISESVEALKDAPNQLLPAVAKIWDPVRLTD